MLTFMTYLNIPTRFSTELPDMDFSFGFANLANEKVLPWMMLVLLIWVRLKIILIQYLVSKMLFFCSTQTPLAKRTLSLSESFMKGSQRLVLSLWRLLEAVFVFLIICRRSSSTRRIVVRRSRETFCNAAVTKNVDSTTFSVRDVEKVWYGLGEKFGDFFCFRQKSLIMKTIDLSKDYAED